MAEPELSEAAGRPTTHIAALDGLRGMAILFVLGHNFQLLNSPPGRVARVVEFGLDLGWVGVQLFFVLSGFLITRILLASQQSPEYFRSFYARRSLRIFPLYFAVLAIAFLIVPLFTALPPHIERDRSAQLWLWTYLSNWAQPFGLVGGSFPHFWSLAVEEQFYLVWPLLVHRRTAAQVLRLCLWITVLSLLTRVVMLVLGAPPEAIYMWTICRVDALAAGGAGAALLMLPRASNAIHRHGTRLFWAAIGLAVFGIVVTRGYPRMLPVGQSLGYTWLALVFGLLVLAAAASPSGRHGNPLWRRLLCTRPLLTMGKFSYAMYVFHKPVHDLIGKLALQRFGWLHPDGIAVALAYALGASLFTLGLAFLSYHLFEKHFLNLKRYFDWRAPNAAG